jgi:hypothetical protein
VYKKQNPDCTTQLGFGDIPMREGELMCVEVNNSNLKRLGWSVKTSRLDGILQIYKEYA